MRSIVFEGDTWERRLSHADRLIYRFDDDNLYVIAIGGHYET